MKVFRNNICYVEVGDLLRMPLPSFIKLPTELDENRFVEFDEREAIEYFKDREDILDYDFLVQLSSDQ